MLIYQHHLGQSTMPEELWDPNLQTLKTAFFLAESGLRAHRRQLAQKSFLTYSASDKRSSKLLGYRDCAAKAFKKTREERTS